MLHRLMAEVAGEIQAREEEEIARLARQGARLLIDPLSEETLLKQKSEEFVAAMYENREVPDRPWYKRLLGRQPELRVIKYRDYMEADFVTISEHGLSDMLNSRVPAHIEQGLRTEPFDNRHEHLKGTDLTVGWRAGLVSVRKLRTPPPRPSPEDLVQVHPSGGHHEICIPDPTDEVLQGNPRLVRIWGEVSGMVVGQYPYPISRLAVEYDINRDTGDVMSYTANRADCEVEEVVKSAGIIALGILHSAIEFVQQ